MGYNKMAIVFSNFLKTVCYGAIVAERDFAN
jgi:hypothetical protein